VLRFIFHRILIGIITVFFIMTIIFFALRFMPGDPAEVLLGDYATPELIELTKAKWGLDKPLWNQYLIYMSNLIQGNLDNSLRFRVPVSELLFRHYPFSLRLMLLGTLICVVIAIPTGIIAAVRQNSYIDMFVMVSSFIFISMPAFFVGLLFLFIFALRLGWFPAMGGEKGGDFLNYLSYLALPAFCFGLRYAGMISRMVRSSMIDILSKEYILVARSKGLSENVIRFRHALRNALAPIVSFIGVALAIAVAGAVVLEVVFSRPGIGRLFVGAVAARDYPLVQGCILIICIGVVIINILVDISYRIIDPRVQNY
jgi:peptide/nickel transport system permease protein